MKKYFVQIWYEGEFSSRIMTELELAEHWEMDDIAGIGCEYRAFDIDTFGQVKEIDVYETVQEVLKGIREMRQEYDDYCRSVREYGYDF